MQINKSAHPRGRPIDSEKQSLQKAKLLNAAEQLLSEKSYSSITIRELAQRSAINSAMISYYFDNKEGLFLALIDEMSKKHFVAMKSIAQADNPIKTFIITMLTMLNKSSGIASLFHSDFLDNNSTLGNAFVDGFPKKMAVFLPVLIKNNTMIKDDDKAKLAAFSLISMIITPFVNKSIRQVAWQIDDEELKQPLWAEHVYQQFMMGCDFVKKIDCKSYEEIK